MTTIALELERTLERLAPDKARVLESRVHEAISDAEEGKEPPTLEEIKRQRPDLAHLIGAWADEDPVEPEELPMPRAKTW